MYKLYLDDIRVPTNTYLNTKNEDWVVVRSYDEFVKVITERGLPEYVSFDHDLGQEHYVHGFKGLPPTYDEYKEKTGMEAAKWLVEYCMDNNKSLPQYLVHSANPIGRDNINSYLESFKKSQS